MSKKKIEVSTIDGESAVLDMALTKTTTQVVVAAGLGLIGGLLASRLGNTDSEQLRKARLELDTMRETLASIVREDGVSQQDVDKAIAEGQARAEILSNEIANLQAELGSRPTKATLDEANAKLAEVSAKLKAEVDAALDQLANLRDVHQGKLNELAAAKADLERFKHTASSTDELDSAVTSLLSILSHSLGISSSNSITTVDRVREAQTNALNMRVISPGAYDELDHKASELAGLPHGDSILGHGPFGATYDKLRDSLIEFARSKDVNAAYEEGKLEGPLSSAGSLFEIVDILESRKEVLKYTASYWWLEPTYSYGTAFLNHIMDIIQRGKRGELFGNDSPIAIAFHGLDDSDHIMFTYSAANGVRYTSHFMREYFNGASALGRVKLMSNSINQEFDLSINGLTLLRILDTLNTPSYLYEGGHVRVSEGFLYRDYSAREALADAVSLLGEYIEGRPIDKSKFNSPIVNTGDINFIRELLKVKERDDAVSVSFFL